MSSEENHGQAVDLLEAVHRDLATTALPLALPGSDEARLDIRNALAQLEDYILPRYRSLDAPLLAVVGGSTGAGKSTLVNGLVGHAVTRAGAIRPTTRQPILLHHPADGRWFEDQRVLPSLSRIRGTVNHEPLPASQAGPTPDAAAITSLVLVADPAVPQGIALLDAPDVDSVSADNRQLAGQLLAAADLWVFVTTANRYADAVPWRLLLDAASRDIMVAVVLDRVPPAAEAEVSADLQSMLSREGLGGAQLFVVPEAALDGMGMLPPAAVEPLRALGAGTRRGRRRPGRHRPADAQRDRQGPGKPRRGSGEGRRRAGTRRRRPRRGRPGRLPGRRGHGSLRPPGTAPSCGARSWPAGRTSWAPASSSGRWSRTSAGSGTGWVPSSAANRHRRCGWRRRSRPDLQAVIIDEAANAAEDTDRRWRSDPAGRQLLGSDDLSGTSDGFAEKAAAEIRAWQGSLMELIRTEGQGKRTQARWLSFGINGLGAALMIVVFSMTAGLTGLEVGVAGGTAVVGQRLLEAVFGEDAVRRLAKTAREDLHTRCQRLLEAEQERFLARLEFSDGVAPAVLSGHAAALRRLAASA